MALRLPLCLFNRHAPTHNRVKWDGFNFVSTCRYCAQPIRRKEKGQWRKEWLAEQPHRAALGHDALGHEAPAHEEGQTG